MAQTEIPSIESLAVLRRLADAHPEPSADLWTRIEAAHATRTRRRRLHRLVAGGAAGAVLFASVALVGVHSLSKAPNRGAEIDWQARAQALEVQLQALRQGRDASAAIAATNASDPATVELEEVDHRLQAAYEHGAYSNELVPLWKRRSELLDTLITARKEGLKLTRI